MSDDSLALPLLGDDAPGSDQRKVDYLASLAREASAAYQEFAKILDENENIYSWGELEEPDEDRIVLNPIQDAIIASTDLQTKEPFQPTLEPVETGEPPLYYWAGPPEAAQPFLMAGLLQPFEVAEWEDPETGETKPPTAIDPLMAGQIKALAVPEEMSPALPPGTIRPEWLVELNDKAVADFYQPIFDLLWKRCAADRFIRKSLLDTNIRGWSWGLYEFDDVTRRHILRHLPPPQVYVDPTVYDISDATYAGFDLPIDAGEARAQYPHLIDAISASEWIGNPQRDDSLTRFSSTFERKFERPMVTFRVFWLRNQIVPMTKEEAIATGDVAEQGSGVGESSGGGVEAAEDGLTPPPADCILTATGAPTAPGLPNWPTRLGIRQITQLGGTIVDDRESEFGDRYPILHNVNIPMPGLRPFGFGEPYRLKSQQKGNNALITAMVEHAGYFASPVVTMSESMHAALPKEYQNSGCKPGMVLIVNDEVYNNAKGQVHSIQEPSPTPPALPLVFGILKDAIEQSSGHTEALRGVSNAQDSGRKTELLQAAGSSQIGFKAARTGDMVEHLSNLMFHSAVWRLTVDDLLKVISKWPRHIVEIIHERARAIEWNVTVVVSAGNGGADQMKQQTAMAQYQAMLISKQTAQEKSRIDSRVEDARQEREAQKMARQAGMVAGPDQEQDQDQQGQQKKSGEKKEKGPPK